MIFSKSMFLVSLVAATPIFVLAALELIRRKKAWDPFLCLLVAVIGIGYLVGGLLFHVQVRYRVPFVDTAFIVLAAAWLGWSPRVNAALARLPITKHAC